MRHPGTQRTAIVVLGLALALGVCLIRIESSFGSDPAWVGPHAGKPYGCAECHQQEVEAWKASKHHTSAAGHLTTPNAQAYISKSGIARDECTSCHATEKNESEGVSCESCHGPAGDWVKTHCTVEEFGDLQTKAELVSKDTPEAKAARIKACAEQGMIHPTNLYELASNCLGCHIVPHPKLVRAGHTPVDDQFDLLAWSQNEVRHNFLRKDTNGAASPERQRALYVVGKLVDLEYSLRALAVCTTADALFEKMKERAASTLKDLGAISKAEGGEWKAKALGALKELPELLKRKLEPNMGAAFVAKIDKYAAKVKADIDTLSTLHKFTPPAPPTDKVFQPGR